MVLRKGRLCLELTPYTHSHMLNSRPSQGTKAEKVRKVQTSSLFDIGPHQVLSWDLPGLPGEEVRTIQEPLAQFKLDSSLGCGEEHVPF